MTDDDPTPSCTACGSMTDHVHEPDCPAMRRGFGLPAEANSKADRSTYKNLVAEGHNANAGADLVKAPPAGDQLVAHEIDPQQLCGTCLHQRRRHPDDQRCRWRDPHTGERCNCATFLDGPPDIEDPTNDPTIEQLPAVTTSFTPEQFQAWLASEGEMFVVYLPAKRNNPPEARESFVIKVPEAHNAFFVSMMQQVRFCLGGEVQAVRMNVVTGPPADTQGETYAPGADPVAYAEFTKAPPTEFTPGEPRKARCPGSGTRPTNVRGRNVAPTADNPGYSQGRGNCPTCGGDYKLTHAGNVRVHYVKA